MKYRHAFASAALVSLLLAGCGGGGGGGAVTATGSAAPLGGGTTTTTSTGTPTSGTTTGGSTTSGGGGAASGGGTATDPGSTPVAQSAAFQVNATTAGVQNSPAAAALEDGGSVIAWHTDETGANGIYVRRFAADGAAVGGETRIDVPAAGRFVSVAKVVGLEGGGYAVAWQSRTADYDQWAVHVRHVRADGSMGAVRDDPVRWFQTYEVASLAGGGYALLLQGPTLADGSDQQLRLERFGPGDALLDTQPVDVGTVFQFSVHAVALADGRRLVSWVRNDIAQGTVGLFFRFMAADGALEPVTHAAGPVSGAVSTYVPAALRDGGFVIAGVESISAPSGQSLWVQRFTADGTPAGSRIRVDDESDVAGLGTSCFMSNKGGTFPCPFPWQLNPAIAGTADGGFVVAWETPDRQRPGRFIYARRFDAAGNATGAPSAVDAASPDQGLPVAAAAGQGFVVTWVGRDADQSGIFARHYRSGELR